VVGICGYWDNLWSRGMIGFEVRCGIFSASKASLSTSDVPATRYAMNREILIRLALANDRLCFDPLDLCIFIWNRLSPMLIS
jgi:hypothetical protein